MAAALLSTVLNIVRTNPVRRGMLLAVLSLGATFLSFILQEGEQNPPHYLIVPCAIGFITGWLMMFIGTLVWLHKRKTLS